MTVVRRLLRTKPTERLVAEGGDGEGGELRRTMGLWQLTLFSVGATLGTGIFVILSQAVPKAGPAVTVAFVLAAVTALFSALWVSRARVLWCARVSAALFPSRIKRSRMVWPESSASTVDATSATSRIPRQNTIASCWRKPRRFHPNVLVFVISIPACIDYIEGNTRSASSSNARG